MKVMEILKRPSEDSRAKDVRPTRRLLRQCIGREEPELVEALSHFPKHASDFIKTQNYAKKVTGQSGVHSMIQHQNPTIGYRGVKYTYDEIERLDYYGYAAERVRGAIGVIKNIRGEFPNTNLKLQLHAEDTIPLLESMRNPSNFDDGPIVVEAMRIMRTTEDELVLAQKYLETPWNAFNVRDGVIEEIMNRWPKNSPDRQSPPRVKIGKKPLIFRL